MERTLGGLYHGQREYLEAMREAKVEFDEWERSKRRNFKMTKEKYRAKRLAKLHILAMEGR